MEIQKTINYFQFKQVESNRPVDKRHVNELVEKINEKNLLHLFPILVNTNMEVIDGQHRLAAAEQLKVYIFYIIADNIGKADIAKVNAVSKNWSITDYINYWATENKEGFDKLTEFMLAYPLIPPSTAIMMLAKDRRLDINSLKQGEIDVSNFEEAKEIADVIVDYSKIINFAYSRNFILAVLYCMRTPGYDHAIMKRKLEYNSRALVKCVNLKQYYALFEEIYNHGQSKFKLSIRP